MRITIGWTALGTFLIAAAPAAAQQNRLKQCHVGQRVADPAGAKGTVTGLRGEQGCDVQFDGYRDTTTYAAWLLTGIEGGTPAPGAVAARPIATGGEAPKPGLYQCTGGAAAGNMKLRFGAGGSYANEQGAAGSYRFRPSGQMEFVSGPWKGFFAKTLGNGRVGLTSRADGTFYQMTCDPR